MAAAPLKPLSLYFVGMGIFSFFLLFGYVAGDCDSTLAIMGYNLLGEQLAHPPCGTGAVLFLRFVEAMWFGTSAMFVTLGVAPRFGVPVSKEIYAIVFWFFLVPVFLGYILAFVVTEIEPGNHALLSIPASLRAPWATCTRCDRRQVPVRSQRHLPRSLYRGFPSLLQAR